MATLRFYSKAGCHLCEEGARIVEALARRHDLALDYVDIAGSAELTRRHGPRIPVVELDGREIGWGRLREDVLEAALDAGREGH